MRVISAATLAGAAMLVGCASSPGLFESKTPPKIIVKKDKKIWDNVSYFGKVPLSLTDKATAACATMNTEKVIYVAKGYHSKALNEDGTPFPAGGYYCVAK